MSDIFPAFALANYYINNAYLAASQVPIAAGFPANKVSTKLLSL